MSDRDPPAWYKCLVVGWDRLGSWSASAANQIRLGLQGARVRTGSHADALLQAREDSGAVRAFLESPLRWIPPDLLPTRNSLHLTPGEIARFFLPPDLQRDPDVFAASAFYQGVCNRLGTELGYTPSRRQIDAGVHKISSHPTTLILVASPHMRVKNLIQMRTDSMELNLIAIENSLAAGSRMSASEIHAWLSCPAFEVALQVAVEKRRQGDRRLPIGWWKAGGEPFSPAHNVQPIDEATLVP